MKLVTGDWHLDENPINNYRWRFLELLVSFIDKNDIDSLIFLGDLTERKDRHSASVVNDIVDFFYRLRCMNINIVFICGNHDVTTGKPFFYFLEKKRLVDLFVENDNYAEIDNCLFMGFTKDRNNLVDTLNNSSARNVFMHQQVDGLYVGNTLLKGDFSVSDISKFDMVISGHIHQNIRVNNLIYCGSPYQVDFGEEGGTMIILDDNYNFVRCETIETIRKHIIRIHNVQDLSKYTISDGDIVKVVVESENITNDFEKDILKKLSNVNVVSIDYRVNDNEIDKQSIIENMSDVDIFMNFCKDKNIDKYTIDVGLELLKGA